MTSYLKKLVFGKKKSSTVAAPAPPPLAPTRSNDDTDEVTPLIANRKSINNGGTNGSGRGGSGQQQRPQDPLSRLQRFQQRQKRRRRRRVKRGKVVIQRYVLCVLSFQKVESAEERLSACTHKTCGEWDLHTHTNLLIYFSFSFLCM